MTRQTIFLILAFAVVLCFLPVLVHAQPVVAISFVLDESGSIISRDFALEQQGYMTALSRLPADGSIEVSVIYFSDAVRVVQAPLLLTPATLGSLQNALSSSQVEGNTNLGGAILTATQLLTDSTATTRILCLSTDGEPNRGPDTRTAADAARDAGILVSPIGIGLGSSGETLLNAIASAPPVPNPATFEAFGDVVVNKIGAGVGSALNLAVSPNPLDFGTFLADPTLAPSCGNEMTARLTNRSDRSVIVRNTRIVGSDASQFRLVRIEGGQPLFPFELPPRASVSLVLALEPTFPPPDSSYDATLEVVASNAQTGAQRFSTPMVAAVDPQLPACLKLEVVDARPLIEEVDGTGLPRLASGALASEVAIANAAGSGKLVSRNGLAADHNARLLLRAVTPGTALNVRFEIDPNGVLGELFPLDQSSLEDGSFSVEVPSETLPDGTRQATVLLRAPERFLGTLQQPNLSRSVRACLVENGACSRADLSRDLEIHRAPVILIHGLWSDNDTWETPEEEDQPSGIGMRPTLEAANFITRSFDYDSDEGPSVTMTADQRGLALHILDACAGLSLAQIACTRADLVAHSMGGLVARRFVHDNDHYESRENFHQGGVRRILTMGTPYRGSPLASLLRYRNSEVGNCIDDLSPAGGLQNVNVSQASLWLALAGNAISSAILDLTPRSPVLRSLINPNRRRPTLALYGNIGKNWDPSIDNDYIVGNIVEAGCTYDEVFDDQESDGIVAITSARGVSPNSQVDNADDTGVAHTEMTTNRVYVETTRKALLAPRRGLFGKLEPAAFEPLQSAPVPAEMPHEVEPPTTVKATLQLTVSSSNPNPGTSVTFRVAGAPNGADLSLVRAGRELLSPDPGSTTRWTVTIPKRFSGTVDFQAVGIEGETVHESDIVTLTVVPDLGGLRQLDFEPNRPLVLTAGYSEQLRVTGLFSDGLRRNLTESAVGTIYSERIVQGLQATVGDSPVIKVSPDGHLVAREPGTADVVATNNGISTVLRVIVRPADNGVVDALGRAVEDALDDVGGGQTP